MTFKQKVGSQAERTINRFTKAFGLRVILSPEWALHGQSISYRADGLITSHNVNFVDDEKFNKVIRSIRAEVTHSVYHLYRIYLAVKLAEQAVRVPNSIFVECGVGEGIISLAINRYLGDVVPDSYLVDTFAGVDPRYVEPQETRGMSAAEYSEKILDSYRDSGVESVGRRFAGHRNVKLVKGTVPDVLEEQQQLFSDRRVSFLHIDMNNAYPEYCALKFFYERLSVPGFVLLDDYGFKAFSNQRTKIDQACQELGIPQPISLPTGQGLILRSA